MNVRYQLIAANELDSTLVGAWRAAQFANGALESPYFCPEFTQLVACVRDDVRVVVIENDGRPVGFFPFQHSLWGMGKPVGGRLSDYHGVVAEAGSEWNVGELLRAARLAVWTFDHLVGETQNFEEFLTGYSMSPQIDLSTGYERYVQGRRDAGSDYIKKTEALERKLGRDFGDLQFTLHEPTDEVMEKLVDWKSAQYCKAKLINAFGVVWTRELLRKIANTQNAKFSGMCSVLRVADRIVAVHMGMRSSNVLHYWFPAYDPAFSKFSTGIILLLRIARALTGTGVKKIDLGGGDAQYKQRLMTGAVELRKGTVELPSLLARARHLHRIAEARASQGGIATMLKIPLKIIRRIGWRRIYR